MPIGDKMRILKTLMLVAGLSVASVAGAAPAAPQAALPAAPETELAPAPGACMSL